MAGTWQEKFTAFILISGGPSVNNGGAAMLCCRMGLPSGAAGKSARLNILFPTATIRCGTPATSGCHSWGDMLKCRRAVRLPVR